MNFSRTKLNACLALLFPALGACAPKALILTRSQLLMGHVPVNVSIRTNSREKSRALGASEAAYRLARHIESRISEFQPDSDTSCLNRNAGKSSCPVSPETLELLK